MILLYADDPGGVNYLAPVATELAARMIPSRFVVDARLDRYVTDRGIECERRDDNDGETLLRNVDVLVVGTSEDPRCFAHRLTAAARAMGTPSIGAVDLQVNADNRFRGETDDALAFAPDYLAVPDDASKDAFAALGFARDRIYVCGHPHYDRVRDRRLELEALPVEQLRTAAFPDAPHRRPIWLFVGEGVDRLNPAASYRTSDYSLGGRGDTDFRGAIVLEEIIDAAERRQPRPWIVLRLHPKNRREDFAPCLSRVDAVSADGDPLPLVWSADLTLGMTSMLLLEACLLGRPHMAVLPRECERGWLPTLASGLTPVATTRDALANVIDSGPPVPARSRVDELLPRDAISRATGAVVALMSRRNECSQQYDR